MKHALKIIIPILLVAALLVGACWYFLSYRPQQVSGWLASWAQNASNGGRYDRAIHLYNLALRLDPSNEELILGVANAYGRAGNYTKTEYYLVNAIADDPTNTKLYLALSKAYVEQDKLLDAQKMLDQISEPTVKAQLDAMRPAAPVFSPESGVFNENAEISISYAAGIVYTSVDGQYPSTSTDPYAGPVVLEPGEIQLQAVAVDMNGLVSALTTANYTVNGMDEQVVFSDETMEAYTHELLQLDESLPIMASDIRGIQEAVIPENVMDLTDLKWFTGLKKLTAVNLVGADFGVLDQLTELEVVDLSGSGVSLKTLESLGRMENLRELSMVSCGISKIGSLSGSVKLEKLMIGENAVADISALTKMTKLETLDLHSNSITDITPLQKLGALKVVDLSENDITSAAALQGMTNLEELNLTKTKISDLTAVGKLYGLKKLTAENCEIKDLAPLAACTKLTELNLANNVITDIAVLAPIHSLTVIQLDYNEVVNLPKFGSESQLINFSAAHNLVEDVSGLSGLQYLNYVNLDYNNVRDISSLADCPVLVSVNVFGTYIGVTQAKVLMDKDIIVNFNPA